MESSPAGLQGIHWSVLSVLKKYGEVPVDFVARVVNLQRRDVEQAVQRLENAGTVQKNDDRIKLKK